MPKKIDDELQAGAIRLVNDHRRENSSLTTAAAVVAKQARCLQGVGTPVGDPVPVDGGERAGATGEELAESKALKAKVRRLEEDNAILKSSTDPREVAPRAQPAQPASHRPAADPAGPVPSPTCQSKPPDCRGRRRR